MDRNLQKTIIITAVTAILTLISGIVLNHIQHVDQMNQDKIKFDHEMIQDRLKFEYDIVSNILKTGTDQNDIWKKLRLYSKLGLITSISKDSLGIIANEYTDEPVNDNKIDSTNIIHQKNRKCTFTLPQNKYRIAKEYEDEGYTYLLKGDISKSAMSFKKSDSLYPGYHNSYELYSLLRMRKYTLNSYYYLILKKYSWGISKEFVDSIRLKLYRNKKK